MASSVLLPNRSIICHLNPASLIRTGIATHPAHLSSKQRQFPFGLSRSFSDQCHKFVVKVSANPLGVMELEKEEEKGTAFDAGAPPPFNLYDIRAAIPKHCWVKDPWRSTSYVVRDIGVVLALASVAAYVNSWFVWPLYWATQGTMFWAIFVLGHDCGHGSFSNNPKLNSVVGHLLHSSILVPYNGWRISHRTHHQNHGHVENDESWHPVSDFSYRFSQHDTDH